MRRKEAVIIESVHLWTDHFPSKWELLNAGPEQIQAVAKADPWPGRDGWPECEIKELIDAVEAFRRLYQLAAQEDLDSRRRREFDSASERVTEYFRKYFATAVPGVMRSEGDRDTVVVWYTEGEEDSLAGHADMWLRDLLANLDGSSGSTIFVCKGCGTIGPAERRGRKWCSDKCRMRASRAKGKKGGARTSSPK